MKKGTGSIVFGWLLVAMQIMALMGSQLENGFAQLGVAGLVGYFLPGILGVVLLYSGYKKRNRWKENNSEENPDTLKMNTERIHNHDIQEKKTIAKFCGQCGTRLDSTTGTCPNRNCSEYVVLKKIDDGDGKKSPKRPLIIAIAVAVIALICYLAWMFWPCSHDWAAATCSSRKICKLCGETEGETRAHDWVSATCTAPKTCKLCGVTQGEMLGHTNTVHERQSNSQNRTETSITSCAQCGEQLSSEKWEYADNGEWLAYDYYQARKLVFRLENERKNGKIVYQRCFDEDNNLIAERDAAVQSAGEWTFYIKDAAIKMLIIASNL